MKTMRFFKFSIILAMIVIMPLEALAVPKKPVSIKNTVKSHDAASIKARRQKIVTQKMREDAAIRREQKIKNSKKPKAKQSASTKSTALSKSNFQAALTTVGVPGGTPDYFNSPNWAFSPQIRKFVDTLPGLGASKPNNLGQYIPVALPDTSTYPGSDYYEIAVIEYKEKMHSDLPNTTLRGYIQLETPFNAGSSKHIPLKYPNGSPILSISGSQVYAYDNPHYLGPTIIAQKDKPTRIKFTNYLPTGTGGDLFIPVDTTVMGAGMGPTDMPGMPGMKEDYKQNRATLHLHGGLTPWISDGTPHQWTTPAGENTAYPKGVSVSNVPDMPDPGPGSMTFFYTNQEAARLMFYHDHSFGITRLNVYAGEAAPYILQDPTEQNLVSTGILPAEQIPLVIQDKTFVDAATIGTTDPTWNWGSTPGIPTTGDLWVPHVYMPNQNPNDLAGINPFGRWDYGPWFWPPWPAANPPITNPDGTVSPNVPNVSMGMEAFNDTPVINGTAYPSLTVQPKAYRFRILNAANDRFFNLQLYIANPTAVSSDGRTNTEVKMIPAVPGTAIPANWPAMDNRVGGVPDPSTVGPAIIQIGTEGGFLPNTVNWPNIPIGWDNDPKSITVGNVKEHNLLLGAAERADVVIDFSAYAGKTLILYNDAPAAFPASDARLDYFTGHPDYTSTGGASSTPIGFGPNTRTIMQIKVAAGTPVPFNKAALDAALPAAFAASQDQIIVPQAAYNAAYNGNFPSDTRAYSRIMDNSMTFAPLGTTSTTTINFNAKSIAEEFESVYGRMSGFLGVEVPFTNGMNQTTIFYDFQDPTTEIINDTNTAMTPIGAAGDGTQIWKITHNGVDTHPIHFHLFNVQLINRVDWAGVVKPPEANEVGWKETVRMNPLEDAIVALRPTAPKLPFGIPESVRLLDPTMPVGTATGFKNVDPLGNPIVVTNQLANFGWEYMWHCHILSHEEMDMMRPIKFNFSSAFPMAPSLSISQAGNQVNLAWTDGTPPNSPNILGNPANEIGFKILRAPVVAGTPGSYVQIGTSLANTTTYSDTPQISGDFSYQVVAYNAAGSSTSTAQTAAVTVNTSVKNMTFNPGWNLVTLPLQPVSATNSQPISYNAETFGQLIGADVIAKWSTSTQQYNNHIVGLPVNNFNLSDGLAFFAHVLATSTASIIGLPITPITPIANLGWNLIGWTDSISSTAHSLGLSLGADLVSKFNNISQQFVNHIVSLPVNNFAISQGDGIFVHKP
jgi:FtsP/CotA-like multicopper oxidase with cupredoxin domain